MGALKYSIRLVSQNLGPVSYAIYRAATLYIQSYKNINHDMNTNGEFYILNRMADLGAVTIFDVGANKGEYTNACLDRLREAKIHAFELVPETYAKFLVNVKSDRVTINKFGLSDKSGEIDVNYNSSQDGLSSLIEGTEINKGNWNKRKSIVRTGDEYCKSNGIESIDLLKMDVEGAENLVLGGFSEMLSDNRISAIQFEFGMINIYSKFLLIDFWNLLSGYGFVVGPLMPRGVDFKKYNVRDEAFQGPPNYVAVHSSKQNIIAALKLKS